jgi:hypothetical protein
MSNQSQSRSLWLGDVENWMDEAFVCKIFQDFGKLD